MCVSSTGKKRMKAVATKVVISFYNFGSDSNYMLCKLGTLKHFACLGRVLCFTSEHLEQPTSPR